MVCNALVAAEGVCDRSRKPPGSVFLTSLPYCIPDPCPAPSYFSSIFQLRICSSRHLCGCRRRGRGWLSSGGGSGLGGRPACQEASPCFRVDFSRIFLGLRSSISLVRGSSSLSKVVWCCRRGRKPGIDRKAEARLSDQPALPLHTTPTTTSPLKPTPRASSAGPTSLSHITTTSLDLVAVNTCLPEE